MLEMTFMLIGKHTELNIRTFVRIDLTATSHKCAVAEQKSGCFVTTSEKCIKIMHPQVLTSFSAFLLLSVALIIVPTNGLLVKSTNIYKEVIQGIHSHFNNTCIILMHTLDNIDEFSDFSDELELQELQTYFSKLYIRTASMDLSTFETQVGLKYFNIKRPLFVLLNDFDNLRDKFAQGIASWIAMAYPTWLIFFRNETSIDEFFKEIYVPLNCMFLISRASEENNGEVITEVYQIHEDLEFSTLIFGTWVPNIGMTLTSLALYQRRGNLWGQEIRVTSIEDPPLSIIVRNENGKMINLKGFFGTILQIIEKSMNCTFLYFEAKEWGTTLLNGSASGVIKMLLDNEIDLAAVSLMMTTNRLNHVSFTTPVYTSRCRTYIKKPDYAAIKWKAYTAPFNFGIWNSLVILILVTTVSIFVAKTLINLLDSKQYTLDSSPSKFLDITFVVYGALCSQGIEHSVIDSVRLIHVVIHMTGVIIVSAYSAALISFLAVKIFVMPFTTMEGLLEDGTYTFGVIGNSADYDFLHDTSDETLRNMFDNALDKEYNLPNNYFEGLQNVCGRKKYSFMTLDSMVAVLQAKVNCSLEGLDVMMQTTNAMAVQKLSPYQGIINANILMMKDSGIMQRLFTNEWVKEAKVVRSTWSSVEIVDIIPLMLLLFGGMFLGTVLLYLERVLYSKLEIFQQHRANILSKNKM